MALENHSFTVQAEKLNDRIWLKWEGYIYSLPQIDTHKEKSSAVDSSAVQDQNQVLSPIPGQIIKVSVKTHQKVEENQALLILSSMKMEYILKAPYKSLIKHIKIKEGDKVTEGQELILLSKTTK